MTAALHKARLLKTQKVPLDLAQVGAAETLQLALVVLPFGVHHDQAKQRRHGRRSEERGDA